MKEKAAEELRLTSDHMHKFGLVDGVVPEPLGGAHWDYNEAAQNLKTVLIDTLKELKQIPPEQRINERIKKFGKMGFWDEAAV
jgi:acetyl-CoA carboxylase carboxyl transferase subunit alpha